MGRTIGAVRGVAERHKLGKEQHGEAARSNLTQGSVATARSFPAVPRRHFREALRVGGNPTPTELAAASDVDLEFAAHVMCKEREELEGYRERSLAALKELKH